MKNIILAAEVRSSDESVRALRADRVVPAIVYGRQQEAVSLKLWASEILKVYRDAWESHIISLEFDNESVDVLIHEVKNIQYLEN